MTKFKTKHKAHALRKTGAAALITAATLTLALLFTGCPNAAGGGGNGGGGGTPTPKPKHAITFSVDGGNGTLTAKVDGSGISSGAEVEQGKTIVFTATANSGYRVKGWTLDGKAVNGTNNSYSFPVTKAAEIKVSFESGGTPPTPPVPVSCSITFSVEGGHGTLKAKADGVPETETSPISVEKGKTVTFTANPDSGYKVKEWQIIGTGMAFEAGTGTAGNNTAQVNLQADLTVKVSFEALPPGEASYTVKHYQEGTDGNYPTEPTETEDKSGAVGTNAVYTPKTGGAYEGFTYKSGLTKINGTLQTSGMIKPDGSTVVELYYERNTVSITFGVDGTNGTLKATVDGNEINTGDKVKHGKTVTFTATPNSGYKVKEWKADGAVVTGNTSNTYICTVTKAVHVTVSFAPPDVGSFEDTGDGFIKITPPANGIVGVDPDYTLLGNQNYWKGVFIENRKVKLSPYKLGKTEVTYKLWKEVYDEAVKDENGYKFANAGQKGSDGTGNDEEQPVTMVSWWDCIVWCNAYTQIKLGSDEQCVYRKKDDHTVVLKDATDGAACDAAYADMGKKGFRLPTEAEWEYAARWQGSDKTNAAQYEEVWLTKLNSASGAKADWNDAAETGAVAWYSDNSGSKTHPVGERRANALGLHDMSGNVWEWCFDWYGDIEANTVTDPQGGAAGTSRVGRGGSWSYYASRCTVGKRFDYSPFIRNDNLGFRLACLP